MGYGPVVNGKQMPITPREGAWYTVVNEPTKAPNMTQAGPTSVDCTACGAKAGEWCWAHKSQGLRKQIPHKTRKTAYFKWLKEQRALTNSSAELKYPHQKPLKE